MVGSEIKQPRSSSIQDSLAFVKNNEERKPNSNVNRGMNGSRDNKKKKGLTCYK